MPQLAAAALVSVVGGGAAAVTAGTAFFTAAMVVGGRIVAQRQAQRAAGRARDAANSQLEDRRFTVSGAAEPQQIIIGRVRAGGVKLAPGWSHGTNNEYWTIPLAFAGHEIVSFDDVYLGEESCGPFDGNGQPTVGSKYYSYRDEPRTTTASGGAVGTKHVFSDGATTIRVDSIAYEVDASTDQILGALPIKLAYTLTAGTEYSVARNGTTGNLEITWLVDTTGKTLTITSTARTGQTAYVHIKRFLGIAAGQRDNTEPFNLESVSTGEWQASDRGEGIARLHLTFKFNPDIYPNGPPNPSAIMTGARHYDPRLDSTNGGSGAQRLADPSTWSAPDSEGANPALAAAWYLMSDLGFGCTASEVDWPSVIVAANACDENVTMKAGGTQKRYRASCVLSTAADRRTNLDKILSAMAGVRFNSGGKWYLKAGVYSTPILDLTDDDLADGTITIIPRTKRRELFNSISGTFIDKTSNWAPTNFPSYSSPTYVAEDGGEELWSEIELPATDNPARAQRIALLELNRARQALRVTATFKPKAWRLQPEDRITWTSAVNGWTSKVFRVLDWAYAPHGNVQLVLQEDASVVYGWSAGDENVPDPAPNTLLPDPRIIAPLANFRLSTGGSYQLPDGTAVAYCEATWDAIVDSAVLSGGRIEIWWKRSVDTAWRKQEVRPTETSYRIEPVSGGDTINVVAWVYNGAQVRSPAVFVTQGLDPSLPTNANVPPLSANLLANAALAISADPWTVGANGFASSAAVFRRYTDAQNSTIVGSPSNCALLVGDTSTGNSKSAYALSAPFAVKPGEQYCAYVDLIGFGTDARVQIEWLTAAEAYISSSPGNSVAQNNVPSAGVWNDPERYSRSSVVAIAPSNARIARVAIVALGNWTSAATKFLSVYRPFAGVMPEGATSLPPWDAGGNNPVDTLLIAPGAATRVFRRATVAGPIVLSGAALTTAPQTIIADLAITEDLRGFDISVTATFDYHAQSTATLDGLIQSTAWLAVTDGLGTEHVGTTRLLLDDRKFPPGYNAWRAVELSQRWTVTSAMAPPYTFRFRAREKFATQGSTVSADVSNLDLSVEVIKR